MTASKKHEDCAERANFGMNFARGMMPTTVARAALIALCAAGFPLLSACSSDDDINLATYVEQTEPADVLYNQGLANLEQGRLKEAGKKFEAVDRQHPYSEQARKSMVMGAFAQYRQGNYDDAINTAKRYVTLYPTSPDAAYAKIRYARDQLAGKEMQIGRYYLERREYIAAIKRFRNVVESYSNTRQVEEALSRLTEAYYAMGLAGEAQTAAAVLGNNYPDSPWYKDAYALLQSGGLEPRENSGSWLSQAGKVLGTS
jgi:outer membrane protein assembly factor BamD